VKQRLRNPGSASDAVVTARAFAARADRIGLIRRGEAGIAGARQDIARRGGRVIAIPVFVANGDDIKAAAKLWHKLLAA
jgi:hypothetical protein